MMESRKRLISIASFSLSLFCSSPGKKTFLLCFLPRSSPPASPHYKSIFPPPQSTFLNVGSNFPPPPFPGLVLQLFDTGVKAKAAARVQKTLLQKK